MDASVTLGAALPCHRFTYGKQHDGCSYAISVDVIPPYVIRQIVTTLSASDFQHRIVEDSNDEQMLLACSILQTTP